MRISQYLREIERAATNVLDGVWSEHRHIKELEGEWLRQMEAENPKRRDLYRRLEKGELSLDELMERHRTPLDEARAAAEERVKLHRFSIDSLAASVLQFARQGISMAHGSLATSPPGRFLGSQGLTSVVWHARNQAIHWEDGDFRKPTTTCFELLARELDKRFGHFRKRSMAFDVVLLLGWVDFPHMAQDLKHLDRSDP